MAGVCVERRRHDHPRCASTSKSLQIFLNDDNTYSGFCFSCCKVVKDPYGDNPPNPEDIPRKTQEDIEAEINDIRQCPTVPFTHRAIDPEDWKYFGVRLLVSPHDGKTPYAIAHPNTKNGTIIGFKIKLLDRKVMWSVGDCKGSDLYGWERAKRVGGTTLYITEGEEDAIALRKILKILSSNNSYEYAVTSLPSGVNTVQMCLGRMAEEINQRFKEVVLVYDQDKPGAEAVRESRKILPNAKVAMLPEKDANECLKLGRLKATRDAIVFQAAKPTKGYTLQAAGMMDKILKDPEYGYSFPWGKLTKLTYGLKKQKMVVIGGGTGCGKTLTAHELAAHLGVEYGLRTLTIFMEEAPRMTYRNIAGKIDNIPYHVPREEGEEPFDNEQLKKTVQYVDNFITAWDIETIEDPETTWAQIENVIRTQGHLYDCVIIDNATTLSEGLSASERNDFLGKVASEYQKLSKKFDFIAVMYSHLNAPSTGPSHEEGGRVLESQFTGSRAWQRYADLIIGFERNKHARDPDCSIMRLLKDREFGRSGWLKTYYNRRTGRLKERDWPDEDYKTPKLEEGNQMFK